MNLPKNDGHYLLCLEQNLSRDISSQFKKIIFNEWVLYYHKDFPLTPIFDQQKVLIGYVLGTILPQIGVSGSFDAITSDKPYISYDLIKKYSGSYLIFGFGQNSTCKVILNAGGTLPAVYGQEGLWLASSPLLSLDNLNDDILNFRDGHFSIRELNSGAWYPFGLTAYSGIRRLLPNHQLDLTSGKTTRVWPAVSPERSESPEKTINSIAQYLSDLCKMMPAEINLPLTAGMDSRVLLAATLAAQRNVTCFTLLNNFTSIEKYIAPRVAKLANVPHKFIEYVERPQSEIDSWFLQTGYSAGGALVKYKRSLDTFVDGAIELDGVGGETARRLYDLDSDVETRLTLPALISRMGIRFSSDMKEAANEWLENTEHLDPFTVIKLLYVENRVSSWAIPQVHGRTNGLHKVICPYSQFQYIDLCLKLPTSEILSQKVPEKLINILKLPFNKGSLLDNLLVRVNRAKDIKYLSMKLKQYYGRMKHDK